MSINSQIANSPGTTVSTLLLDVTIGVAVPTALSTFLFTISNNFEFTVSSLVTSIAVTGDPPQILSTSVVSANIIRVVFNEQFVVGRQFRLTVSNIYNPLEISSGAVSLYSLPYNSITPLEVRELSIPLQTVSYTPTLSLWNAEGLLVAAPMEFYMETLQYITLKIVLPYQLDPSFVVQVASDVLLIEEGTVYLSTSTLNSDALVYSLPNANTVQVAGFPSVVPTGTTITVTLSAWIDNSPIFNIYVSIDTLAHITAAAPIIYGTTSATVSVVPSVFISALTDSVGEPNKLTAMQTGTSSIQFTVTPLFQTVAGSFLEVFTRKDLVADASFSGATSCLVNSVAQPCSIATGTFTVITIASSSSANLYPITVGTTISISQLQFNYASSHSNHPYHFYFQLTVSLAEGATAHKHLIDPMVVPQRNQMAGFGLHFSNNINNTGSNFLNVVRLVSSDPTQWNNVVQVN